MFSFLEKKKGFGFQSIPKKTKSRYFTIKEGENLFENNLGEKVLRGLSTLLFVEPW